MSKTDEAFEKGRNAYYEAFYSTQINPYDIGTEEHQFWLNGWWLSCSEYQTNMAV